MKSLLPHAKVKMCDWYLVINIYELFLLQFSDRSTRVALKFHCFLQLLDSCQIQIYSYLYES